MTHTYLNNDAHRAPNHSFMTFFVKYLYETGFRIKEKKDHFEIDTGQKEMDKVKRITLSKESIEASQTTTYEDLNLEYCIKTDFKEYRPDLYHVHSKHIGDIDIALLQTWHKAKATHDDYLRKLQEFNASKPAPNGTHHGKPIEEQFWQPEQLPFYRGYGS